MLHNGYHDFDMQYVDGELKSYAIVFPMAKAHCKHASIIFMYHQYGY